MFTGSSIDDLIAMVESAERHAVETQKAAAADMGPALVYESQPRAEVLEGVA